MSKLEAEKILDRLADAIRCDDEAAGQAAVLELGKIVIGSLLRIADALEHIGRNLPAK